MKKNHGFKGKKLAWLLYNDLNTRLGILYEEFAHLQQHIYYYGNFEVSKDENDAKKYTFEIIDNQKRNDPNAHSAHHNFDKTLLALYNQLGSALYGINAHQKHVQETFEAFIKEKEEVNVDWFWFASLRSFIINDVFEHYMREIEHAHEKLIQVLETKRTTLPQPILLRRWNSSIHGSFLSDYSRFIERNTAKLTHLLSKSVKNSIPHEFDEQRKSTYFTHSWSHTPTSMVASHRVRENNKDDELKFGSIRSAFFYLEMPTLHPLLYHECAHLCFDWNHQDNCEARFYKTKQDCSDLLQFWDKNLYQIDASQHFWDNYVEEIWADAIAIALGGVPYLVSLVMQTFGQASAKYFNRDESIPLQDWGKEKVYDFEQPTANKDYLWSTRLRLVIQAFKHLNRDSDAIKDDETAEFISNVESAIESYEQGGAHIFQEANTSRNHELVWKDRDYITNKVHSIISDFLMIALDEIKSVLFEPQERYTLIYLLFQQLYP